MAKSSRFVLKNNKSKRNLLQYAVLLCMVVCMLLLGIPTALANDVLDQADMLMESGQLGKAREIYLSVLQQEPTNAYAMQGVALCSINMGDIKNAVTYFELAVKYRPDPELFYNLGRIYFQIGDLVKSFSRFTECSKIPSSIQRECHIKLAQIHRDQGNIKEVQLHLHAAIKLDPSKPDGYIYLADSLNNIKQFNLALEAYENALRISPTSSSIWNSKGDTYINVKKPVDALNCFNKSLVFAKKGSREYYDALTGYFYSALELASWKKWEVNSLLLNKQLISYLQQFTGSEPPLLSAYRLLFLDCPADVAVGIASVWSNRLVSQQSAMPLSPTTAIEKSSKHPTPALDIAYMSRRFEDYPGTQMMMQLFQRHNRTRIATVAALAGGIDDKSVYRNFIKTEADSFDDYSELSIPRAVELVRQKKLDIVVDYDGMHDFNSMKLLASRLATVQATWLGFGGSSGQGSRVPVTRFPKIMKNFVNNPAVDYIIVDKYIMAPDLEYTKAMTEHLVLLPICYQPQDEERNLRLTLKGELTEGHYLHLLDSAKVQGYSQHDSLMPVAYMNLQVDLLAKHRERERTRLLAHVKAGIDVELYLHRIWLISFNRRSKITPEAFEDWMQIMLINPSAVLFLMSEAEEGAINILREAAAHGVSSNRLVFCDRLRKVDFYSLLAVSDLFLDTRPYNSHTVATDALRGGLPVVSLMGDSFSSRVAGSISTTAQLDNLLVATNRKEYIQLATNICQTAMTELTAKHMKSKLLSSVGKVLFNSTVFSSTIERAYLAMSEVTHLGTNSKARIRDPSRHLYFPSLAM